MQQIKITVTNEILSNNVLPSKHYTFNQIYVQKIRNQTVQSCLLMIYKLTQQNLH